MFLRYFGGFLFTNTGLIIRDVELVKKITIEHFDHFQDHNTSFFPKDDDIFSKNLFSMKGSAWREMRATLNPAFSSGKMSDMFGLMDQCAKRFVDHFVKMDQNLIEVEMRDVVTKYTNDVIASTCFGMEYDSLANPENEFYKMGSDLIALNDGIFLKLFVISTAPWIAKVPIN